ncbi:MAG: hypothetical protein J7L82_05190, partial [Staphylothermus sp.]|nr:hypothetical protein [Staphylothermus sp.]
MNLEIHHFMVELKDVEVNKILNVLETIGEHTSISENTHVFMGEDVVVYVTLFSNTLFMDILVKDKELGIRIVKNIVDIIQPYKIMTHYVYRGY